jgi:hypothetical protein
MTDDNSCPKPTEIICGKKLDVSSAVERLTSKPTPIKKVVVLSVRAMGTNTFLGIGNEEERPFKLTNVNMSIDIDFIDDFSKILIEGDGADGEVQWIGG